MIDEVQPAPDSRVLVIIPAYNEQDSILDVVASVKSAGYDYIVVNDGSSDATLEICRMHGIRVLNLPNNLGIGGAVQAGHMFAREFDYDIDIQFDGDGQHDSAYLCGLVEQIQNGADLAVGSRYLDSSDGFKSTLLRRIGQIWLSGCLRLFCGVRITDPTSGLRACGRRAISLYADDYPIDYPEPESIAVAVRQGYTVREIPVTMHERQGGVSSIDALSSIYYMVKVTLAIIIAAFNTGRRRS